MPALYPACAEYCSRGSLYDCLAAAHDSPAAAAQLTWQRRLSMAVDGGTGLLYLHRRNIIHRDGEAVCRACAVLIGCLAAVINGCSAQSVGGTASQRSSLLFVRSARVAVKSPNLLVDEHWRVKVSGGAALSESAAG